MKRSGWVICAVWCTIWVSGCSSSSETLEGPTAKKPSAAIQTAYFMDHRGLVRQHLGDGTTETIERDLGFAGNTWPSPDLSSTAVSVRRSDADYLALLKPDGSFRILHGPISDGEYSVVWSPAADSLLVGYKSGDASGVVVITERSASAADVGCRASNIALSWGEADWFVVGDATNHYIVERNGCATLETVDTRKLYETTFGPRGKRVAYILRELEYDRQAREYRPDSSLYVADSDGINPVLVVGDRYRPHNPAWAGDGMSLAFDARLPDDESRRLISIFDVEEKRSTFMNPDAVKSKLSERDPVWSPSGEAIAYLQSSGVAPPVVAVRDLTGSHTRVVGREGEVIAGWLDAGRLVVRGDGGTRVVGLDGREVFGIPTPALIVGLSSAPTPPEVGAGGSD